MLRKLESAFSETEIDGEVVVMMIDTGEFLSMEGTAGAIWALIDGTRGRDAIVTTLAADYSAPADEIARDVDEFLSILEKSGLIARN